MRCNYRKTTSAYSSSNQLVLPFLGTEVAIKIGGNACSRLCWGFLVVVLGTCVTRRVCDTWSSYINC